MKKIIIGIAIIFASFGLASCDIEQSSNDKLNKQQEELQQESISQVGMPAIVNFQEKKIAKMIFELRDRENLSTYTYITAQQTGKLILICKSIGYGLPYSIQYTNPQKIETESSYGIGILTQADPNGLFMPDGLLATWVMCIGDDGQPTPTYIENEILVSTYPLN